MFTLSEKVVETKSGGVVARWKLRTLKLWGLVLYRSQVLIDETEVRPT